MNKFIIGKVLREEDLEAGGKVFRKFINYAENDDTISFRVYLTSEEGNPRLYNIFLNYIFNPHHHTPYYIQNIALVCTSFSSGRFSIV